MKFKSLESLKTRIESLTKELANCNTTHSTNVVKILNELMKIGCYKINLDKNILSGTYKYNDREYYFSLNLIDFQEEKNYYNNLLALGYTYNNRFDNLTKKIGENLEFSFNFFNNKLTFTALNEISKAEIENHSFYITAKNVNIILKEEEKFLKLVYGV